jgi:hypothetical protein
MSPALERAVTRARDLYVRMTPEQRCKTLHPKHLDHWLANRRVITIVARDLDDGPVNVPSVSRAVESTIAPRHAARS